MLKLDTQMQIKGVVQEVLGDELGELMQGFAVDAADCYYRHLYWKNMIMSPKKGEIQFRFCGVQERVSGVTRQWDILTIRPAEGVAIAQPEGSLLEIIVDDLGAEDTPTADPYYMGYERINDVVVLEKIKSDTKGLYAALADIRRCFSFFDLARGSDRVKLARMLEQR